MTIDEAIAHAKAEAELQRKYAKEIRERTREAYLDYGEAEEQCAEEHEQLAEWLEELKALRLLLDWATECDFGLDSFPEEYEKYKHTLTEDMTYNDMIIQIAKCVVAEQLN